MYHPDHPAMLRSSLRRFGDHLVGTAAAAVDRAFVTAIQARNQRSRGRLERMTFEERIRRLVRIGETYGAPGILESFFPTPPLPVPALRRVAGLPDGGEVLDAAWPSPSVPYLEELRAAYLETEPNRTAHARLFVGRTPRPAVILIHGYLGGRWSVEERAWPIAWMRRRGLDVALALLPFHGLRAHPDGKPRFPGADPRFTNEGFRQAIADLRGLIQILRARGAPSVGVMGMSLGGYSTSLLATLEPDLAFAVPIIPLASIADFARDQGRLGSGSEAVQQHRALERANWVVSPFARPSCVAKERMLIVGAEADRITPITQAERLARHFGAPMHRLVGGHLLQIGRGDAFRAVGRMWRELGIG